MINMVNKLERERESVGSSSERKHLCGVYINESNQPSPHVERGIYTKLQRNIKTPTPGLWIRNTVGKTRPFSTVLLNLIFYLSLSLSKFPILSLFLSLKSPHLESI